MLLKSFKVDELNVRVFDSRLSLGEQAAAEAAACLKDALKAKEEINVIFAAAPSQNEFLHVLTSVPGIDWGRVNAFHMDEYVGLNADAPQGFGNFLRRAIFDRVPFKAVYYIGAERPVDEAIDRYAKLLKDRYIDVIFMGIGENGHIAFNDPHIANFNDTAIIKCVDLDLNCRTQQVHDGCFARLEDVPEYALTLTCPVFENAGHLFCMVPAATKADAVKETVFGGISEKCPATIMRRHKAATLYVDSDSGKYIL